MTEYRRPGINVGDIVRVKLSKIDEYRLVYGWLTEEEPLEVVARRLSGFGGPYWVHCRPTNGSDHLVMAKPSHLNIAKPNPNLQARR